MPTDSSVRLKMFRRHRSATDTDSDMSFRNVEGVPAHVRERLQHLFGQIENEVAKLYQENINLQEKVDFLSDKLESCDQSAAAVGGDSADGGTGGSVIQKSAGSKKGGSQFSQKIKSTYKTSTSRLANTFKNSSSSSAGSGGGQFVRRYSGHSDGVWDLNYSSSALHQQPLLVSASSDYTAKVWCAQSGSVVCEYYGHKGSVNSARFHPTGDLVLTGSGDHTAHIWRVPGGTPSCNGGSQLSDGQRSSSDEDVCDGGGLPVAEFDALSDSTPTNGAPASPVYSPVGNDFSRQHSLSFQHGFVGASSVNGNGTFSGTNGSAINGAGTSGPLSGCGSSPGALTAHTTLLGNGGGACGGMNGSTNGGTGLGSPGRASLLHSPITSFHGHTNVVSGAGWVSDGAKIVSGSWDSTLLLHDTETSRLLRALLGHDSEVTNVCTHSSQELALSSSKDSSIRLWDLRDTGNQSAAIQVKGHAGPVNSAVFAPGDKIVSASEDRTVKVWDMKYMASSPYATLRCDSAVNRVAVSAQGLIAVPQDNRSIRLFDLQGARLGRLPKRTREGHTRMVCCVAWADDPLSAIPNLFSCSFDRQIIGWQVASKGSDGASLQKKS